jgi:hypothetical protein
MTSKLTLSVEENVIIKAKEFAKSTNKSLSKIIENYLRNLTSNVDLEGDAFIDSIAGKIQLPEDFDEEKAKREYLEAKYLG